jgi:hypothetical protein
MAALAGASFNACKQAVPESFKRCYADVCEAAWPGSGVLPVCYHERYNFQWMGLQNLSSLDACKPRYVLRYLHAKGLVGDGCTAAPLEASDEALLKVHDAGYLEKLKTWNLRIAQVRAAALPRPAAARAQRRRAALAGTRPR